MSIPYRTAITYNRILPLVHRSLPKQQYQSLLKPNVYHQSHPINISLIQRRPFSLGLVRLQQVQPQKEVQSVNQTTERKAIDSIDNKEQNTSTIKKYYNQVKELISFYKAGLKQLWENNKAVKELQTKMQQENYILTRSEFQKVHITKIDMRKLIPFSIIFFILPESIPLFVMFAPGVVPSTCVTENQMKKQREKLDKARQIMSANVLKSAEQIKAISPEDFLSLPKFAKIVKHYNYDFELGQIDRSHLSSYCRFMGLSGYGTRKMLQNRLNNHFDYLSQDDQLISKEGIESLTLTELQQASEERGMRSLDVDESHLRQSLGYWLAMQSAGPVRGMLVFSRMFLLNAKYN